MGIFAPAAVYAKSNMEGGEKLLTNVYASIADGQQGTGYGGASASVRYAAMNAFLARNGDISGYESDGAAPLAKDAGIGFNHILLESFSGSRGENAARKAGDAAVELAKYGKEAGNASGRTRQIAIGGGAGSGDNAVKDRRLSADKVVRANDANPADRAGAPDRNVKQANARGAGNSGERRDLNTKTENETARTWRARKAAAQSAAKDAGGAEDNEPAAENRQPDSNMLLAFPAFTGEQYEDIDPGAGTEDAAATAGQDMAEDMMDALFGGDLETLSTADMPVETVYGETAADKAARAGRNDSERDEAAGVAEFVRLSDFEEMVNGITGTKTRINVIDGGQEHEDGASGAETAGGAKTAGIESSEPQAAAAAADQESARINERAAKTAGYRGADPDAEASTARQAQAGQTGTQTDGAEQSNGAAVAEDMLRGSPGAFMAQGLEDLPEVSPSVGSGALANGDNGRGGGQAELFNAGEAATTENPPETAAAQNMAAFQANQLPETGGRSSAGQIQRQSLAELMPDFEDNLSREARVILDGGKHEFIMQLKPDNLGKVAMRIVTENGLVTARFYVENDRAREALEENLAGLGESLSELGLNIRGCSVEVRNGGDQAAGYAELSNGGKRNRKTDSAVAEGGIITSLDAGAKAFLRNLYFDQQSSVHYTA